MIHYKITINSIYCVLYGLCDGNEQIQFFVYHSKGVKTMHLLEFPNQMQMNRLFRVRTANCKQSEVR